jgi:hypothetical protein
MIDGYGVHLESGYDFMFQIQGDPTLTVATNPASIDSTTGSGSYTADASVSISAPGDVDIVAGQSRYHFDHWTGTDIIFTDASSPSTTMTMPASGTMVAANYVNQYKVTFTQSGIGTDTSDTVVTVGGVTKTTAQLPFITDWINSGTSLTYAYASPVGVNDHKQYIWSSTSGLSQNQQGDTFNVTSAGTINGNFTVYIQPKGVGGEVAGINKLSVLAPWFLLAFILSLGGVILVLKRR